MGTINYHRQGEIIEIRIKDFSGANIETIRCPSNDRKRYKEVLRYLDDKYGFKPEIDVDESVNAKQDIDWWK